MKLKLENCISKFLENGEDEMSQTFYIEIRNNIINPLIFKNTYYYQWVVRNNFLLLLQNSCPIFYPENLEKTLKLKP